MRIRTLFLLTSLTSIVACGGDDEDTDPTLGGSDPSSSESGSATLSTTTPDESSSGDTLTTTTPGTESSESGSESSAGPADSSSGSESGSDSGSTGEASTCQLYCDLYLTNCTVNGTQYADEPACLTACEAWEPGTAGDMDGNTQACHLYHAGAAAGDPALHCPHSQEVPDGGCV